MKPMLSATPKSLDDLQFPAWCTPKLDGIRCLTMPDERGLLGAYSRTLKLIPNQHVQRELGSLPSGLDGELMIPGATCFGDVSSAVMSRDGQPDFEYHVFDCYDVPEWPYVDRITRAALVADGEPRVRILNPLRVETLEEFLEFEAMCTEQGYEGVMTRTAEGLYKHGRSTVRQGWLVKWKRWDDSEAVVIGFEEMMHNDNEQTRDELGHAKRSTHKAGKRPAGVLGKLLVRREDGVEFAIGSGFTAEQRKWIWADRPIVEGTFAKYKHQPHGAKDAPRCPIFQGFRHEDDL